MLYREANGLLGRLAALLSYEPDLVIAWIQFGKRRSRNLLNFTLSGYVADLRRTVPEHLSVSAEFHCELQLRRIVLIGVDDNIKRKHVLVL